MALGAFLLTALCAAPAARPATPVPTAVPEPLPRYPLGTLAFPDFLQRGEPLLFTDVRYIGPQVEGDPNQWLLGVRWLNLGYVSLELADKQHGVAFRGHRLGLAYSGDEGSNSFAASFRTARVIASADARSNEGRRGHTWIYAPTLQFRLTSDVELYGWVQGDSARPHRRSLTEYGAGAVWQRGAWLETNLEYVQAYTTTAAGDPNRVDSARAAAVAQLAHAELTARARVEETRGRFPRREAETALGLRLPLSERLLLEGSADGLFDSHAGSLDHGYGGGLTWFGRRFTLPRAGRMAERSLALARAATAAGEYELRAFDEEGLRAQRERLSLSRRAQEQREAMEAVYRAQIEERALPLLGLRVRHRNDRMGGERLNGLGLLVGMPWPPAWPWSHSERAVPFLKLELESERLTTASHFRSETHRASLTVVLNREMDVVATYTRAEPTARDVVLGRGLERRLVLSYVYARGR
jgi:hypothetical protein